MHDILAMGARAGELLKARGETIAIGETSAGGLISASLLAVPGASAYFQGGAITYARPAITGLAGISLEEMRAKAIRSSSEPYALMLAKAIRERLARERPSGVTWGLSETGAAGPNGNPYGDASGHTCMAVVGETLPGRSDPGDRRGRPRRQHVGLRRGELGAAGRGARSRAGLT